MKMVGFWLTVSHGRFRVRSLPPRGEEEPAPALGACWNESLFIEPRSCSKVSTVGFRFSSFGSKFWKRTWELAEALLATECNRLIECMPSCNRASRFSFAALIPEACEAVSIACIMLVASGISSLGFNIWGPENKL